MLAGASLIGQAAPAARSFAESMERDESRGSESPGGYGDGARALAKRSIASPKPRPWNLATRRCLIFFLAASKRIRRRQKDTRHTSREATDDPSADKMSCKSLEAICSGEFFANELRARLPFKPLSNQRGAHVRERLTNPPLFDDIRVCASICAYVTTQAD